MTWKWWGVWHHLKPCIFLCHELRLNFDMGNSSCQGTGSRVAPVSLSSGWHTPPDRRMSRQGQGHLSAVLTEPVNKSILLAQETELLSSLSPASGWSHVSIDGLSVMHADSSVVLQNTWIGLKNPPLQGYNMYLYGQHNVHMCTCANRLCTDAWSTLYCIWFFTGFRYTIDIQYYIQCTSFWRKAHSHISWIFFWSLVFLSCHTSPYNPFPWSEEDRTWHPILWKGHWMCQWMVNVQPCIKPFTPEPLCLPPFNLWKSLKVSDIVLSIFESRHINLEHEHAVQRWYTALQDYPVWRAHRTPGLEVISPSASFRSMGFGLLCPSCPKHMLETSRQRRKQKRFQDMQEKYVKRDRKT